MTNQQFMGYFLSISGCILTAISIIKQEELYALYLGIGITVVGLFCLLTVKK